MAAMIDMKTLANETGLPAENIWPLPLEDDFLAPFLRDLFENHYDKLTFGPLIQGAAYELKAPAWQPTVSMMDGYLTVHWGRGGHFHLCIGQNRGSPKNPTPPDLIAHRAPSQAELFRRLDRHGKPVSWGFRMANGKAEPQISIFFPNPFITDEDQLSPVPDWSRLAFWHYVLKTYAGQDPDGLDDTGAGFGNG